MFSHFKQVYIQFLMFKFQILSITIFIAFSFNKSVAQPDKIVCYFDSWAYGRPSEGAFQVEDIDVTKCTHLIYAFIGIKSDGNVLILDGENDINKRAFNRFTNLKRKNPNLKTLVAIGGANAGSKPFSDVAKNIDSLNTLAASALRLMNDYGFDGLDLDWENPAQNGGETVDKDNFYTMIKILRDKFNSTGKKYLLTAAVSTSPWHISQSYDIPNISSHLDFFNFMTYDFHSVRSGTTGINSPLYAHLWNSEEDNINAHVVNWISKGVPSEKIILGIPTYAKSYNLINENKNDIGSPSRGAGPPGPYTNDAGTLSYAEVCEMKKREQWNNLWDDALRVPYMYRQTTWVSYENEKSIKEKVTYAKGKNLGGVMIWSISMDDFKGLCGTKYPLLTAINNVLFDNIEVSKNILQSQETWTTRNDDKFPVINNNKQPLLNSNTCIKEGFFKNSKNCSKFYRCDYIGGRLEINHFDCPGGLFFNEKTLNCDYTYNVKC